MFITWKEFSCYLKDNSKCDWLKLMFWHKLTFSTRSCTGRCWLSSNWHTIQVKQNLKAFFRTRILRFFQLKSDKNRTCKTLNTHISFCLFLSQIEVDHCGYGIHIDQEEALLISHLGKLQQEGEFFKYSVRNLLWGRTPWSNCIKRRVSNIKIILIK